MKTKTIVIGCVGLVLLAGAIVACVVGGIFFLGLTGYADQAEKDGVEVQFENLLLAQRGFETER